MSIELLGVFYQLLICRRQWDATVEDTTAGLP